MSTQTNNSQTNNTTQNQQDVNEIFKINFEKYFQEVKKTMPQYLQSITKLQEEFLATWENTTNTSLNLQKEFTEKNGIDTNIPQYTANIIHSVVEEYIKSRNIQNQTILSAIDIANNNFKNYKNSVEPFTEINKKLFDFWLNFYSKK